MHAVRVELAPLNHLRRLHEGPVLVVLNHQVDEVQADLVQHIISIRRTLWASGGVQGDSYCSSMF